MSDEAEELLKSGWYDSPAKFPQKGENDHGELDDLKDATKEQLERYAKEVFGVDLDRRKTKANLLKEIGELHDSRKTD